MRRIAPLLALLASVVAGCGGSGTQAGEAGANVVELTSVDTLRQAFAEGEGRPRLLLLLSPT